MNKKNRFILEQLEARLMLSADLQALPVDVLLPDESGTPHTPSLDISLVPGHAASHDTTAYEDQRHDIIFIDSRVPDHQQFVDDLSVQNSDDHRVDIIVLDSSHDGIMQISETLSRYQDIDSVHVVSHGADGAIQLGNSWLKLDTIDAYADSIEGWSEVLTDNADLLFYGCDLAAGDEGRELIDSLTLLTGADVAASTNDTGQDLLGGDWNLEYTSGNIETDIAFSAYIQENWTGVLGSVTVTTTDDVVSGDADTSSLANLFLTPGSDNLISLREAIIAANTDTAPGMDTINLTAGTYTLTIAGTGENAAATGDLDITDNVTLSGTGTGSTIIDGNATDRVFDLHAGTVSMSDLTIQGGDNSSDKGGGIFSDGATSLTLTRVTVTGNTADAGGGIHNSDPFTAIDVEISGNIATANGGGLYNTNTVIWTGGTISGNTANSSGGGIHSSGAAGNLELTNVTISGNAATTGSGGGIFNAKIANLTNVTVYGNTAGGGIAEGAGGSFTLLNTIVANNTGGNSGDTVTSFGGNIDDDGTLGLSQTNDISNSVNLIMGSLQNNGGSTKTHALQTGSDGIDNGLAGAPPTDQRGVSRVGAPDSGAYEYDPANEAPINTVPLLPQSTPQDTPLEFSTANSNAISVSDVDAASNPVKITLAATNGTLTLGWPSGTATAVGSDIPVNSTTDGAQQNHSVVVADDGSYVVVWSGSKTGVDNDGGIFFQRFDATGAPDGIETLVNIGSTGGVQAAPAIGMDGSGNFVVVWESADANGQGIFARRFDASGNPMPGVGEIAVNGDAPADDQVDPSIAVANDGSFVISWTGDVGSKTDVFARQFNSDGTDKGSQFMVNTTTSQNQYDSAMAIDDAGNFVVTWVDSVGKDVRARTFDATGSAITVLDFMVNSYTTDWQQNPSVAMDASGNFVVTWQSWSQENGGSEPGIPGVYARGFNLTGGETMSEFLVNETWTGYQWFPAISMDSDGDFVITWQADPQLGDDNDGSGIYARQYSADGTPKTEETLVNDDTAGNQSKPSVGMNDWGDFVVTWNGPDASGDGIYTRRFTVFNFTTGDGTDDTSMVFTGTIADINTALEGLIFTPDTGFNGNATLTITTDDQGYTGTGGAQSDTDVVNIAVGTGSNIAPTATNDPGDYNSDILSYSPLSYWRLGESSGPAAADDGSSGNNGTYNGGTFGQIGSINGDADTAIYFNGSDYVEISHSIDYLLDDGTVQFWFKADSIGTGDHGLFSKDHDTRGTGGHLTMFLQTSGELVARLQSSSADYSVQSSAPLIAGDWYHVAFTFGSEGMKLFVNGGFQDSDGYTGGLAPNVEPIALGAKSWNSTQGSITPLEDFFEGYMDEVALFGSQLSAEQIQDIYAAGLQNYTIAENNTLTVNAAEGVLINDYDQDSDPLTAQLISGPSQASSFTLNPDGSFSYRPLAGFSGSDTFTYRASDGTFSSNIATVTITVTGSNDAPIARDDRAGLSFDGTNDFVQIADETTLKMTTTMTMEAWVKPTTSANAYLTIMNKEGEYEVALNDDGEIMWGFDNTVPDWNFHYTGYKVAMDEWTHIAVTYDDGVVKTYADGVLVETYNGSGPIGDHYTDLNDLLIGGRLNNPATKYFKGEIDEVRIWNDVRTQAEIQANMDLQLAGNEAGLAGCWEFNEGSGTLAADKETSVSNHGTLGGGVAAQEPVWVRYTTDEDSILNVTALYGVLSNDIDVDGDTLSVTEVNGVAVNVGNPLTLASLAKVTLNADGSFDYDPSGAFDSLAAGASTTDSFTYTVDDGNSGTDTATVVVTITGVNDNPTLTTFTTFVDATNEDTEVEVTLAELKAQGNEADVDGTVDAFVVKSVATGTLKIGADAASATAWAAGTNDIIDATKNAYWKPAQDANGTLNAFAVVAKDNSGAESTGNVTAQVSVTADNDPPTTSGITDVTVNENAVDSVINFFTAFDDVEDADSALTYIITNNTNTALFTSTAIDGGAGTLTLDYALNQSGTADITVRATDTGGKFVEDIFTVTVASVIDAPVLSGANDLTSIDEDPVSNNGTLVSDLISGQVSDPDTGALSGIAVTSVDNTNGTWQYTLNGTVWTDFGTPSTSAARLLASDANNAVRFVPDANWNGTVTNGITFHAWDQTSGTDGNTADLATPITLTVLDQFSSIIYSNNDGTNNWNTSWVEVGDDGDPSSSNFQVKNGGLIVKPRTKDENIYRQADLTGATTATLSFDYNNTLGNPAVVTLQVSGNGGGNYADLATFSVDINTGAGSKNIDISDYIASNTRIRFYVTEQRNSSEIIFDNVQISYDGVPLGGATAFSTASASSSLTVNPDNDDPTGSGSLTTTSLDDNDGATNLFGSLTVTDVDTGENDLALTITLSNPTAGTITGGGFTETGAGTGIYTVSSLTVATANTALDNVQFTPTNNTGPSGTFNTNISVTVNDQGSGGERSVLSATAVTITRINDNPSGSGSLTTTSLDDNDGATNLFGSLTVTDVDTGENDLALTITLSNPTAGTITGGGFTETGAGTGIYTVSSLTVATANTALDNVQFTPTNNTGPSGTFNTNISVTVNDQGSGGERSVLSATAVTITRINDNPSGSGSLTTTSLDDNDGATNLFGSLTVTDVDTGENDLALTITLSNPTAGTITGGGFTETGAGTGIYTVSNLTVATANTALDNVQFTPTNNTGPSGTFNTNISVTVNDQDSGGERSVLSATAVTITRINDNPSGSGSLTTTSLDDNDGATNLFGSLTVTDVDTGENDLALTITLSNPTAGTITGGGFTETGAGTGIYTVSSLTVATANTALDNVQFTPTNNTGPSGTFNTNISVTVNDQDSGGERSVLSATAVTITRINDNPSVQLS